MSANQPVLPIARRDGDRPARPRRGVRRRAALSAAVAAGLALSGAAALAEPARAAVGTAAVADSGAKVIAETVVDARTVDLDVQSPSVGTVVKVRLLLPAAWGSRPDLRWPTLYLYHGANEPEDYRSWTTFTAVETFLADKDVLTVLPSSGPASAFTDEYNPFRLPGKPKWETFHTEELPQILERGYRSNGSRAAAGLSVGGFGALSYAARHPGLFRAAASYSGPLDLLDPAAQFSILQSRLRAQLSPYPFGHPTLNRDNWRAHDPLTQVSKLRGVSLFVSSGDGTPGPLDDPNYEAILSGKAIEGFTAGMNRAFLAAAKRAGVPVTARMYGGGYHYWQYWEREFAVSYPQLRAALGGPTSTAVTTSSAPAAATPAVTTPQVSAPTATAQPATTTHGGGGLLTWLSGLLGD